MYIEISFQYFFVILRFFRHLKSKPFNEGTNPHNLHTLSFSAQQLGHHLLTTNPLVQGS